MSSSSRVRLAGSPGCLGRPGVLVEVGGHVLEQGVEDLVAVGEEAVQGGTATPARSAMAAYMSNILAYPKLLFQPGDMTD